ncbi:hypothetical protein PybrP1_007039 [[Pythium] brassicae (nom. inval.)]|nr:hypothetical protein PybrP1_007039 [[Pythium] brassicae (nom. inval.)]
MNGWGRDTSEYRRDTGFTTPTLGALDINAPPQCQEMRVSSTHFRVCWRRLPRCRSCCSKSGDSQPLGGQPLASCWLVVNGYEAQERAAPHDEEEDEVAEEVVGERALLAAVLELVLGVDLHPQRHCGGTACV